jgi:RNA polymerase sigma-70 factor (ECF subfamily)
VPARKNLDEISNPGAPSERAERVSRDDLELVEAVRRGDGGAARSLYNRLYPVVDYTLRRVLRVRVADFEDLLQVTFERIVRAISDERFQGRSALTTWSAAIASHVAIDHLRRAMREHDMLRDLQSPAGVATPELRMEARSEIRRLQSVLAKMNPKLVEAVLLFDVLGHSVEDVADFAGISTSAAQSRLHRGRRELVRRAGARYAKRR